jgi:predicted nucleic acid-binding protein
VDCWIAQLALEAGAILLHDDDDFERIKQVRPLKTLRE